MDCTRIRVEQRQFGGIINKGDGALLW